MTTQTVDAIVCYHQHEATIAACLESLHRQVRQILVVRDAGPPLPIVWNASFTELPRSTRHGVANSFNYGAFHSNAEWLLYVDPHCIFFPGSIQTMLELAAVEDYEFVVGRGWVSYLDPDSPYGILLNKSDVLADVPLTFLMHHTLWDTLKGIPEVPYAHMDALAEHLIAKGILIGAVDKMCHHHIDGDLWDVVRYYHRGGFSYAAAERIPRRTYTPTQVAQLLSALFGAAHELGIVEAFDQLPKVALDVTKFIVQWGTEE